jgi:hypothetical protein
MVCLYVNTRFFGGCARANFGHFSLRLRGRYVEAEQMHRQELELRQKVLGPKHPFVLVSLNNLSMALNGQGKYI